MPVESGDPGIITMPSMRPPLSAVLITKNASSQIEDCLKSAVFCLASADLK